MYLKSLTLKGFKSFASATTLRFEPGITCVVGPNGSGKSNVVDALRWVLGEQGAKNLRGGKMDDVIFMGTSGRSALGRAEVTVTIDNSDGHLPIDYTEISLTRRMFRDGASEYEIGGQSCRLLDIHELLSDSGIGHEQHVIVGQGQVSDILQSRPEDRRTYIEEAAGVLKHRKRKERAERKLQATAVHLTRLKDLSAELRRQLKPLSRQAEAANKAAIAAARLRDASLRLAGDEIYTLHEECAARAITITEIGASIAQLEQQLAELTRSQEQLDQEHRESSLEAKNYNDKHTAISTELERAKATLRIAQDRQQQLSIPPDTQGVLDDPDQLTTQLEQSYRKEEQLKAAVEAAVEAEKNAQDHFARIQAQFIAAEKHHGTIVNALSAQRERRAVLQGKIVAIETKIINLQRNYAEQEQRYAELKKNYHDTLDLHNDQLAKVTQYDEMETRLTGYYEQSCHDVSTLSEHVNTIIEQEQEIAHAITTTKATITALEALLVPDRGVEWVKEHCSEHIYGILLDHITVTPGWEYALTQALGAMATGVIVSGDSNAYIVAQQINEEMPGEVAIIVVHPQRLSSHLVLESLAEGLRWASTVVSGTQEVVDALYPILENIILADDIMLAQHNVSRYPDKIFYTRAGDRCSYSSIICGGAHIDSALEIRAKITQHSYELEQQQTRHSSIVQQKNILQEKLTIANNQLAEILAALSASDQDYETLYQDLARLHAQLQSHTQTMQRVAEKLTAIDQDLHTTQQQYAQLNSTSDQDIATTVTQEDLEHSAQQKSQAAQEREIAQQAVGDAHLGVKLAQERALHHQGFVRDLQRRVNEAEEKRQRHIQAEHNRQVSLTQLEWIIHYTRQLISEIERLKADIEIKRDAALAQNRTYRQGKEQLTAQTQQVSQQLSHAQVLSHQQNIVHAQQQTLLQERSDHVIRQYGITIEVLLAEYNPQLPLPPSQQQITEYEILRERGETVIYPQGDPYNRAQQEGIVRCTQQELAQIGTVNPLALEEFSALEERYNFLSTQLDDVQKARADLESVIKEIDQHIEEVFTSAYHDIAREFSAVFTVLFPGGQGWLELLDPQDMRTTGFEIHARPPGKKVSRLSLLSGGERTLTAIALLVAIFRARPSPFYIMDEVEAALDDTNLRKLIVLFQQLQSTSQLIIITHQKPMMEIADALYGVTMRGDGISQVISQRVPK